MEAVERGNAHGNSSTALTLHGLQLLRRVPFSVDPTEEVEENGEVEKVAMRLDIPKVEDQTGIHDLVRCRLHVVDRIRTRRLELHRRRELSHSWNVLRWQTNEMHTELESMGRIESSTSFALMCGFTSTP